MEIRAHAQRRRRSATSPTFPDTRASRHSRCCPRIEDVEHAALAVVGIPFDSGTSFRPGARFGPAHIREIHTTSSTMPTRSGTSRSSTPVTSASAPTASNRPSRRSRPRPEHLVARGAKTLALGGDHAIALPCCVPPRPCTGRSRCCTSTPISTPGTCCTARASGTARGFAGLPRKGCATSSTASTSVSAVGSTIRADSTTTARPASRSSEAKCSRNERCRASSTRSASASARAPSCRSTSTCSIRLRRPARGRRRWPASRRANSSPCSGSCADSTSSGGDVVEVATAYDHAGVTGLAAARVGAAHAHRARRPER